MTVCLLTISDGRAETHVRSSRSLRDALSPVDAHVAVDDADHRLGFSGAIAEGWRQVLRTGCDHVLHVELDFLFREPIALGRMTSVLERHPHLAQICLKRQPCNEQERAAGGIVETRPDDYHEVTDGEIWTEHRVCFSTNPCVYPAALCSQGWPQVRHSEGVFTHRLLADPDVRFAFWGPKFAEPAVEHIGTRVGTGY